MIYEATRVSRMDVTSISGWRALLSSLTSTSAAPLRSDQCSVHICTTILQLHPGKFSKLSASSLEHTKNKCSPRYRLRFSSMDESATTISGCEHAQKNHFSGRSLDDDDGARVVKDPISSRGRSSFCAVISADENMETYIQKGDDSSWSEASRRRQILLSRYHEGDVQREECLPFLQRAAQMDSLIKFGRRAVLWSSMAAFGVGSCPCCEAAQIEDWSYEGPTGPREWGGKCATGVQQSPIDITVNEVQGGEALGELLFEYKSSTPTFKNTGHGTMQVNLPRGKNMLRLKGRNLELLQFHFHTPSEHAFDGRRYPMEAHLVHRDVNRKTLAVVGVMLDATSNVNPNEALAAALQYSPLEHGETSIVSGLQLSATSLLPSKNKQNNSRGYMHYLGSLTTPPCSEAVDWFLLETPLKVPTSQVLDFMKYVGDEHTLALNSIKQENGVRVMVTLLAFPGIAETRPTIGPKEHLQRAIITS